MGAPRVRVRPGARIALAAAFAALPLASPAPPARAVVPSATPGDPGATGLGFETIAFPSSRDSVRLSGWWFAGPAGSPVLVAFDRSRGSMADLLPAVRAFRSRGFTVMTFDYRDFGPGGPGAADTLRTLAFASRWVNDGEGALRFARARAGGRPVFAWGQDLGGPVAVASVARDPRLADAVAIEGLFRTTMELLYRNGTSQVPGVSERHRRLVESRDEPLAAVARLHAPLLEVLAGRDSLWPPDVTLSASRTSLSRIDRWTLPEAGHDGAETTPDYYDHVARWFQRLAALIGRG